MATDHDIRCSNACTRAGISVLILSAVAFGMFTPLDRTRNLQNLLTYTSERLTLKEQLNRLEEDVAWRALMATEIAELARKEWNLARLLDYTFEEELKPRYPAPKTEPPGAAVAPVQPAPQKGTPAAPTNLRISVTRRIEPLHRAADALTELGVGDRLTRARRYSPSADRAIYDWSMLRYQLFRDSKARNSPGVVFLDAEQPQKTFFSRLLTISEPSSVSSYTREETVKNLTLPQMIELAYRESPTVLQSEALQKEQTSVTLPALGVAVSIFQGSMLTEFGMLLSLAYFWLYYREARLSQEFPSSATLFGGLARTRLTRWIFSWSAVIPAAAATILAKKSFWYSGDNAVIAALVVAMAMAIRVAGRLPAKVHDEPSGGR